MTDQNSPDIFELKEDSIRLQTRMEEVDKVESRLDDRIKEVKDDLKGEIQSVKEDLHNRISRLETRLQWSVTIAIGVTGIVVAIIVKFV